MNKKPPVKSRVPTAYSPDSSATSPTGLLQAAAATACPSTSRRQPSGEGWRAVPPRLPASKGQRQLPEQPVLKLSDGNKPHLAESLDFHNHEFDDNLGRDHLPSFIFWFVSKERQALIERVT